VRCVYYASIGSKRRVVSRGPLALSAAGTFQKVLSSTILFPHWHTLKALFADMCLPHLPEAETPQPLGYIKYRHENGNGPASFPGMKSAISFSMLLALVSTGSPSTDRTRINANWAVLALNLKANHHFSLALSLEVLFKTWDLQPNVEFRRLHEGEPDGTLWKRTPPDSTRFCGPRHHARESLGNGCRLPGR
jgi:hypothetical protein